MSKVASEDRVRLPQIEISLSEGKEGAALEPPKVIQLARTGKFKHEKYGRFEITPKTLLQLKENFDARVRGVDVALDFRHDNEGEAAAWLKKVFVSEDGQVLLAEPEWTDRGKESILGKRYRYLSPEIHPNYVDNETGKNHGQTLMGAGLTNRPFIKRMAPAVELSEREEEEFMDTAKEVTELQAKVRTLSEENTALKADAKKLEEFSMSPADMQAKIKELEAALAAANSKIAEVDAAKKLSEKESQFALMLSEKKVVPAQKDAFISGDMAKFLELAQPLNLSEKGHGGSDATGTGDAYEKIVKLADAKVTAGETKDQAEAISRVLSENPELSKKYYAQQ